MFLGFSVMTLFEFVEFAVDLLALSAIWLARHKSWQQPQISKTPSTCELLTTPCGSEAASSTPFYRHTHERHEERGVTEQDTMEYVGTESEQQRLARDMMAEKGIIGEGMVADQSPHSIEVHFCCRHQFAGNSSRVMRTSDHRLLTKSKVDAS